MKNGKQNYNFYFRKKISVQKSSLKNNTSVISMNKLSSFKKARTLKNRMRAF